MNPLLAQKTLIGMYTEDEIVEKSDEQNVKLVVRRDGGGRRERMCELFSGRLTCPADAGQVNISRIPLSSCVFAAPGMTVTRASHSTPTKDRSESLLEASSW